MTFTFACQRCGHDNSVEWSQAGQRIGCGGCGMILTVPAPREPVGEAVEPAATLRFACPSCGRKFVTKPDLAGKKIRCNNCGAGVRVPSRVTRAAAGSSRPALKTFIEPIDLPAQTANSKAHTPSVPSNESARGPTTDPSSVIDDLAAIEGVAAPQRSGAVLLSREQMFELARQKAAEREAAQSEKEPDKPQKKKKRKKKSGYFDPKDTLTLVAGVGAFVGVVAFLAWAYPDLRFPLGGFLCVVGFIVYLMGAVSLRQRVAEEGGSSKSCFIASFRLTNGGSSRPGGRIHETMQRSSHRG
jgi:DNA-directed RNA polymerase subunit RPC12/RpoP